MDEKTLAELDQAWGYIQAELPDQAQPILIRIVRQNPKSDMAWYMLSFVLSERNQQIYALQRALALNPGNTGAEQRLEQLIAEIASPPPGPKTVQAEVKPAPVPVQRQATPAPVEAAEPSRLLVSAVEEPKPAPKRRSHPVKAKRSRGGVIFLVAMAAFLVVTLVAAGGLIYLGYLDLGGLLNSVIPGRIPPAQVAATSTFTPTFTPSATLPPPTETPPPLPTRPTATPTLTPTPTPRPAVFTPSSCTFEIPQGVRVECGYVEVPEKRGGISLVNVRLMVAIYHSLSSSPAADPVIFLQGGPGGEAIQAVQGIYDSYIRPILQERDFIVFDQRGSGESQPSLACQELLNAHLLDLRQFSTSQERQENYVQAYQTCQNRLKLMGISPEAYTSAASAADVRDISAALGYQQVNLLAFSYGTRLAQLVMRDYPQLVRSAVLDSVVPLEVRMYNQVGYRTDFGLKVLFAGCAADPDCNTAFPDLEQVFYSLVEQLDATPVGLEIPSPIAGQPYQVQMTGAGLVSEVIWGLYSSYYIPALPKAIYDVQAGDYSYLKDVLSYQLDSTGSINLGSQASINCHEQVYATTQAELDSDLDLYPRLKSYSLSTIFGSSANLFGICSAWQAAPYDPRESEPLVSDLPVLILAGEYDPTTPPPFGQQLHDHLSASYFVELPGVGHSPSYYPGGSCPLSIVSDFLDDPTQQPDTACLAEMPEPAFLLPFNSEKVVFASFTNPEYAIQGIVPRGWRAMKYGFYNRQSSMQDPTQIGMQSAVDVSPNQWLDYLKTNFQGVGLDSNPKPLSQHRANGLTWQLYRSTYQGNPVDIALADNGKGRTYLVLMLSLPKERDDLYKAVYLPVIDALKPAQ
jgi:pimeloyl-ACP methyl ester carboxylesterase